MTDNTFSSRAPNRVVKWRFSTGLQSGDLGSCPSSATLIPYDLRWLRPEGRNFSLCKVRLVRPFFSSSQGYGREKEHHVYERDGSELGEDLASTRNKTWTSEVDEAHRMYHFNPLHCNCRRPEGCRGDGAKGRFGTGRHRGPSESRSEWHFRKSTLCRKRHTIIQSPESSAVSRKLMKK